MSSSTRRQAGAPQPRLPPFCAGRRWARAADTEQPTGGKAPWRRRLRASIRSLRRAAGEIFYGMSTFDWVRDLRRQRAEAEMLFLLIAFGDLVGLPILPPYYTLRLLPHIVPCLARWKRSLLRERDWTDLIGLIEGAE